MASDSRDVLTVPTSVQPSTLSKDIMVLVLTDRPLNIPKLDLVLAISSTGNNTEETFRLMTKTIDWLLQNYDSSKIRYGLLVYGDDATVLVHLKNNTAADQVQEQLKTIVQSVGRSALDKALETAAEMFAEAGDRQDADRVLVIMTDESSGLSEEVVAAATKPLERMMVKIIPVAVGDDVKPEEFKIVTHDFNIMTAKEDEDPFVLSHKIMEKAKHGIIQLPETNLAFAISATALEAEETHTFMKEIIKSIIAKYGTKRLEYSVIVYGDSASAQVLVVITDRSSGKSPQDIRAAVRPLETAGIRVIAVAVGIDPNKIKEISTDGDVIETDNKKDPGDVGEKIIDKVANGKPVC
ncbi:hypothetical protein OS493_006267 [Desmophyllum pertusum]|uniref:VWFA domain-containing protein n=1 Tax=Desmophyllum pertusum TaxID=174260 RepID=A0A9X0DC33_9CNID|nr:hypothetical protein OS493_006267 [Desmophyllum pertusum]